MIRTVAVLIAVAAALAGTPGANAQELFGGKYLPFDQSLSRHQVPKWFHDAKLGIFIHWGLYSVPAWAPPSGELGKVDPARWFIQNPYAEWYANTMKIQDSPTWKHHRETYGEGYDYYRFAEVFQREVGKWDPKAWAALFQEAGARYVVLTTKHHDGFTLWPSEIRNPHLPADRQHANRDLVGELTEAVRARKMEMGLYYSGGLDWSFVKDPVMTFMDLFRTAPKSEEYARYADSHWRELIGRYKPMVLWNDIGYPEKSGILQIFADYYNAAPEGVINNRFGYHHHDFTTPEYSRYDRIVEKKWESCRGLGFSFGYNQAEGPEHVLSADELVDLFVDIVSKNGNLLLNVGPKPDGSIPELQADRLRALGSWLRQNGEAIFETRPWVVAHGRTTAGGEIRFTRKGDSLYAILLARPATSEVTLEKLWPADDTRVALLGHSGALPWRRSGTDLTVVLPRELPDSHAYAIKITPLPWKLMRD